jgi:SAM-dependent methyltransferase
VEIKKVEKNLSAYWDQFYTNQSQTNKEPSAFFMEYFHLLSDQPKALDLACGSGRNAAALALKGAKIIGIDFSEVAIEKARQLAQESSVEILFKKADLDFFIPELLSFDAIYVSHFKPAPTLFNNLIRGLKKGGKLFMEVPLVAAMKTNSELDLSECYHPGELMRLFQKPGLNYRIIFYSEILEDRVQVIATKTEML